MAQANWQVDASAELHSADLTLVPSSVLSCPRPRATLHRLHVVTEANPIAVSQVIHRLAALDKVPKRLCATQSAAGTLRIELDTLAVRPQLLDLISTRLRKLPGVLSVQRFDVPSRAKREDPQHAHANALTDRERQVLCELSQGKSNKLIAKQLALATPTVNYHIQRAFRKLGVRKRALAVAEARRLGWFK